MQWATVIHAQWRPEHFSKRQPASCGCRAATPDDPPWGSARDECRWPWAPLARRQETGKEGSIIAGHCRSLDSVTSGQGHRGASCMVLQSVHMYSVFTNWQHELSWNQRWAAWTQLQPCLNPNLTDFSGTYSVKSCAGSSDRNQRRSRTVSAVSASCSAYQLPSLVEKHTMKHVKPSRTWGAFRWPFTEPEDGPLKLHPTSLNIWQTPARTQKACNPLVKTSTDSLRYSFASSRRSALAQLHRRSKTP